ncbi:MAG: cytochrome o ubiquinol oxidase subunit IV [Hyphomicrobiaceae bacterium]
MKKTEAFQRELNSYIYGLVAALILTALPFGMVAFDILTGLTALWLIAACAIIQIVVHFRYFLHIDLRKQKREDLDLIIFTTFLLSIMVAGTIWIMTSLQGRMMAG